ncbi:putative DNA-binding transcriptional regulator [Aquisphaera giovannonii]|uniref:Putative DNA-binding transcriptional regulator n=1 Tax=Aquisphaera giovannonii TaxID=406548 RepID=A0A5B9W4I5_9BACT|nr:TetR/AcrR family transcriptional regulator [Aquisphaera giovannonii]QEH34981.1 putative DNA-binding transcriptional regulator [Aquisphaera giovannonii]
MTRAVHGPAPRRRDASLTREAILAAATRRFAQRGYEHAGVREIASDAGVTAALVNRYFDSKEGLFAEVIERAFVSKIRFEDRATLAEQFARLMVYNKDDEPDDERTILLLLLRSATEPRAAEVLRTNLEDRHLKPLAAALDGPDGAVRAALVMAHLAGFAMIDQMIAPASLAGADRERLVALLTEGLSVYIDPPAPSASRDTIPARGGRRRAPA